MLDHNLWIWVEQRLLLSLCREPSCQKRSAQIPCVVTDCTSGFREENNQTLVSAVPASSCSRPLCPKTRPRAWAPISFSPIHATRWTLRLLQPPASSTQALPPPQQSRVPNPVATPLPAPCPDPSKAAPTDHWRKIRPNTAPRSCPTPRLGSQSRASSSPPGQGVPRQGRKRSPQFSSWPRSGPRKEESARPAPLPPLSSSEVDTHPALAPRSGADKHQGEGRRSAPEPGWQTGEGVVQERRPPNWGRQFPGPHPRPRSLAPPNPTRDPSPGPQTPP